MGMRAWRIGLALTMAFPAHAALPTVAAIDAAAHAAMAKTGSKGLALALIDHGKVALVRAYGVRNAAGDPLGTDTIMYGASLTKAVFAYTVMQLVDAGKVDLDRPIADMLAKPLPDYGNLDAYGNWGDLAGDDRWRRITPRMVLTHSTGFANFAFLEPDGKLRIHFDPGTRYAYSGEGIMLLQFGIEKGLGLDAGAEVQKRVFDRFSMTDTSVKWRPDFASHLADGWTEDGKIEPHDERSRVRLAGSMDTTIADFAKFAAGLVRGDGLSAKARAEMVRPQLAITTPSQFPTFLPELPADKRFPISAGIGVVTFSGPQGPAFFKTGHNDSTGNIMVCVERGRKCAVILSNDVRTERAFPDLVRAMIGETGAPWRWEYSNLFP
jgi:CubicO group peptidase (beta-lactamase class C family)